MVYFSYVFSPLSSSLWLSCLWGVFGAIIGSFASVVIHRLPIMLEHEWHGEGSQPPLNLAYPSSFCPTCQHPLPWRDKWPLLSYIFRLGKCRFCNGTISLTYFVIEVLFALLFAYIAWSSKTLIELVGLSVFVAMALMLACIDMKTYLLPDKLTLPLMWLGFLYSMIVAPEYLANDVLGAMIAYGILWLLAYLGKWCLKKEALGGGDLKYFAAIGAWVGWQGLSSVLLLSSVFAILLTLVLQVFSKYGKRSAYLPFGPYLTIAAFLVLLSERITWL